MAHIDSLAAAMFSDLSMTGHKVSEADWLSIFTANPLLADQATKLGLLFDNLASNSSPATLADWQGTTTAAATEFVRISHLKEFPALGTPANIVKVPEYGSKTSKQIQAQADLPNMEITLNYVPSLWEGNIVGGVGAPVGAPAVNDQNTYVFRFTLLADDPVTYTTTALKTKKHSCFYFLGKLEALEVTSSLTEAMTAKLTISVQSEIKGAYTNA